MLSMIEGKASYWSDNRSKRQYGENSHLPIDTSIGKQSEANQGAGQSRRLSIALLKSRIKSDNSVIASFLVSIS